MKSPTFAAARTQVRQWIDHILTAVQPDQAVKRHLARHGRQLVVGPATHHLDDGRLFLIGVGKAAVPMAQAVLDVLGDAVHTGVIISKQPVDNGKSTMARCQYYRGDHPVSGQNSVLATTAVTTLLGQTRPGDLVLCLISGGASALLTQPHIPLADWQALNRTLLASGCTIQEFNTVRRQLDGIKGGGLARQAAPAPVISLILSDVVGSDLAAVGSGPTVFTDETHQDALAILERYQIKAQIGTAVWQNIQAALTPTPPTPTDHHTPSPLNIIIGSIRQAVEVAAQQAASSGFATTIITSHLEGEAREAGRFAAAIAKDLPPGHCAILGGETTVTLRGDGQGGRNLEVALAAAVALENWADVTIATFATDGDDGPTGAAGAVVTGRTAAYGREVGLDARQCLDHNDSYTFFKKCDTAGYGPHLIITGPTGTNVNDLIFIIRHQ